MPHTSSRLVAGILLSTLATASFAGPSISNVRQETVQSNREHYQESSPSGFGQRVSERSSTEGGQGFTSFGTYVNTKANSQ